MDKLLDQIRTKEEADKLVEEIDILLSSFYEEKGFGFDSALKNKVRYWVAELISEALSRQGVDKAEYLEKLKTKLGQTKVLTLGVAFEPTEDVLERISNYVNKNFGERIFLKINFMPELIAGAIIIYQGKYSDFSLKKVFENEFRKNKEEIMRLLGVGSLAKK